MSSHCRREERGGGVERGFGLVPAHSVGLFPSSEMRYFQYAASRSEYTHVMISPSLATPGMTRHMFCARFFLLFWRTPLRLRLLLHYAVRSWVEIWSSLLRTTFPIRVSCLWAIWFRIVEISKNRVRTDSLVILLSITWQIVKPRIFRIFRWRNTSNFCNVASQRAQWYIYLFYIYFNGIVPLWIYIASVFRRFQYALVHSLGVCCQP